MSTHRVLTMSDGTTRQIHLQGWHRGMPRPELEPFRIKLHRSMLMDPGMVAAVIDLRSKCSPIEDQGPLGSCTAHGTAAAIEYNELNRSSKSPIFLASKPSLVTTTPVVQKDGSVVWTTTYKPGAAAPPAPPTPAPAPALVRMCRLFQYYVSRQIEGTVSTDSGATIADAFLAGQTAGVCDETLWAYNVDNFAVMPPQVAWDAAKAHKVTSIHPIADGDIETFKSVLASGFLPVIGMQVYSQMMSQQMASTGILQMPSANDTLQGGHCVAMVGSDDSENVFIMRNSWSEKWGLGGYFLMPYAYAARPDLVADTHFAQSAPLVAATKLAA